MSAVVRRFPAGFLWGTAASAHQIEGGNCLNDWWRFEQQPGAIRDGTVSGGLRHHRSHSSGARNRPVAA